MSAKLKNRLILFSAAILMVVSVSACDDSESVKNLPPEEELTLNISIAGDGSGTVSSDPEGIDCGDTCSADFEEGTVVTLTAAPEEGSRFSGWSGACSGTGTCEVTLMEAAAVTATFSRIMEEKSLTVSVTGQGEGSVQSDPAGIDCGETCSADFEADTTVALTATPAEGSEFAGWSGACDGTGACTVLMSESMEVSAAFAPIPVRTSLTVRIEGAGTGTVASDPAGVSCADTCTVDFARNTVVTLTATPAEGSAFEGWGGPCSGTDPCQVTLAEARTVTATFSRRMLSDVISADALMAHLESLAEIAAEAGGTRATGTQGCMGSVSYLSDFLSSAGLSVSTQEVPYRRFGETSDPVLEVTDPDPRAFTLSEDFLTLTYSGGGEVTAEAVFVDPMIPAGPDPNDSDDGCEAADFDGIDLTGKIALIQRGSCNFLTKVMNAEAEGAAAVILFNEGQTGRTAPVAGNLGEDADVSLPVLGMSYAAAESIYNGVQNDPVTLRLRVETVDETANAVNLLAEAAGTADGNVVMLGAHLDSAPGSPGMNNNGSGAMALAEIAGKIGTLGYAFPNTLRFAWWAGGEMGMIGSTYYTESLAPNPASRIGAYINADTIASTNHILGILDGDVSDTGDDLESITDDPADIPSGSGEIESALAEAFASQGMMTVPVTLTGESDYLPFIFLGIPVGGLFSGADGLKTETEADIFGGTAGQPYDPCYAMACDDPDNIDPEVLWNNTKALAQVVEVYAAVTDTMAETRTLRRSGDFDLSTRSYAHDPLHKDRRLRPTR